MTGATRVGLVLGPTPLHRLPGLSAELGVPVLAKRDDLTGAGLGGNKLRNLEFLIADALTEAELDQLLDVRASLGCCAKFADRVRLAGAERPA